MLKNIIAQIRFEYNSLLNSFALWSAKRKADKQHRLTGRRYHVVPTSKGKLMVVDNTFIDRYNKTIKGTGNRHITIIDLLKESYYSTPIKTTVK
jgi:hypothetical protein